MHPQTHFTSIPVKMPTSLSTDQHGLAYRILWDGPVSNTKSYISGHRTIPPQPWTGEQIWRDSGEIEHTFGDLVLRRTPSGRFLFIFQQLAPRSISSNYSGGQKVGEKDRRDLHTNPPLRERREERGGRREERRVVITALRVAVNRQRSLGNRERRGKGGRG